MKKVFIIIITMLCILVPKVSALELNSKNAVLYNMNDNKVVYNLNKDDKTSIASLTKIMTCLVAIENIDSLDTKVVITKDMIKGLIEQNLYVVGLKEGQILTYKDLLYATFLPSGADAANALAISIGDSVENFVKKMNEKAKSLGLTNTHFANPTGLDDINNYGTVDEVAKLLMNALENKLFKEMFETKSYTLSDNSMTVSNSMFYSAKTYNIDINYIIGGKTGYTDNAGKCLASYAYDKENDIYYLLVTTNASTSKTNAYHILDAYNIYNYYFDNYKYYNLINQGDSITTLKVNSSNITQLDIKVNKDYKYYYDKSFNKEDVKLVYDGQNELSFSNKIGDEIGSLKIYYNDIEVGEEKVYLNEAISFSLFSFISQNLLLVIICLLLSIIITLFLLKNKIIAKI